MPLLVEASRVPPGSLEQGTHERVFQEPGKPRRLRHHDGTAEPRATKRGGTDDGVSEHLIVPMKQGNRLAGPCGGKGVPICRTVGGNNAGDIELYKHFTAT